VKFNFIAAEKAHFEIEFMCRMLEVSSSGYYSSRKRTMCERLQRDHRLVQLIHAEFAKHPRGCGSRMVMGELRAQGHNVSRKRIVRLMAQEGLRCRLKRRFVRTTNSKHSHKLAPNVLKRRFEPGAPNKVWVSDITYLHTKRGWTYLAVVLDLGSRKVVGWNVGTTMEESLVLSALRQALEARGPAPGLISHSDRGVQYAANDYRRFHDDNGWICSMSRKGNCWDNAVVESFFSTLKRELPNDEPFEDWREVDRAVFAYIDGYYNTTRRHSTLGYRSPNEYEEHVAT
jgi:transposase InsO family protein